MTEAPEDPTLGVARDLRAIVELAGSLEDQAVHRASHHDMPGGPAMVALGPVASPEAVANVVDSIETGRLGVFADEIPDNDDAWQTPFETILWWSEALRLDHDAVIDSPTLAGEAEWLAGSLRWMYDHEPHRDDFAKDIASARARLEALLYAGERDERCQVPCIDCDTDRDGKPLRVLLHTHYADETKPGWRCPVEDCRRKGPADHWWCPRCRRQYDRPALLRAEHQDLVNRGLDRIVPLHVAADALQLPVSHVKPYANVCELASRSLAVCWLDVRHLRRIAA